MNKLVVFILNKTEVLDRLLKELSDHGIKGGTIIESKGMGYELANQEEFAFFGSLKKLIDPERANNITLLIAIHCEQFAILKETIENVVGDLSKPNTGILFTLPIDYIQGLKF